MQPIVKTSSSLPTVLHSHRWLLPNEQATEAWAQALVQSPQVKQVTMALQGTLGAGKTTLTRYLLRALGVTGRIKSPSYAIVEPYTLACASAAWHFDFYRFSDPREWEDAGFRDVFASPGLKIVEWWQNAQGLIPTPDWVINLSIVDESTRELEVLACSPTGLALLQEFEAVYP